MLDEMFNCVSVKVLVDCKTGDQLYTIMIYYMGIFQLLLVQQLP